MISRFPGLPPTFPKDLKAFENQIEARKSQIAEDCTRSENQVMEEKVDRDQDTTSASSSCVMVHRQRSTRASNAQTFYLSLSFSELASNKVFEDENEGLSGDLLRTDWPENRITEGTRCIGSRITWKDGRGGGLIFYDEEVAKNGDGKGFPDPRILAIIPDYHDAYQRAFENAKYHRLYSELMSLKHTPETIGVGMTLCLDSHLHSANEHRIKLEVEMVKKKLLAIESTWEMKTPFYAPGSNNFRHHGCKPEWLHAINGAMNLFGSLPESEKKVWCTRVATGEDRSSFYVHNFCHLGPLMDALRGYHDPAANYRGPGFIPAPWYEQNYHLVGGYLQERRIFPNHIGFEDIYLGEINPRQMHEWPARNVKTHDFYEDPSVVVPPEVFVMDTQRAHQALQFQHELRLLNKQMFEVGNLKPEAETSSKRRPAQRNEGCVYLDDDLTRRDNDFHEICSPRFGNKGVFTRKGNLARKEEEKNRKRKGRKEPRTLY